MPAIVWDQPEDRLYEAGLDRGVLYLPDGTGVPWNGLISVIEKYDRSTTPVYFDGMKIHDLVTLGDFAATMKAVTYPDEFIDLEGSGDLRKGVFMKDQPPKVFGLSWRTGMGSDAAGEVDNYKIHLLYNVTAVPHEKTYASISNDPSMVEFEWDIVAVPEEIPGFRPTAHIVINSRDVDPLLLSDLETILYGGTTAEASLLSMADLVTFFTTWYRVKITDNGDGTWTAEIRDDLETLSWLDDPTDIIFQLTGANAVFSVDGTQYTLSDTTDASDIATIKITYNIEDDSWSATSDSDILVAPETPDGEFQIINANAVFLDPDTYRISDTGIE